MTMQDFGRFVRELRRNRMFYDAGNNYRQWTHAKLAEEAGLTERQIAYVEQGKLSDFSSQRSIINRLANAFGLSEAEKSAFFAKAGLNYAGGEDEQEDRQFIRDLLEQLQYSASVRTPLWDFVAFNGYHRVLWGYSDDDIHKLEHEAIGPNLLRVLFDPSFDKQTDIRRSNWREEAIWAFAHPLFLM